MSNSALSSNEAAERLGVSPSTIKNWAVRLPVPSYVDNNGTRRFPEEALAVLETVKRMRDDERSYATIRRIIEPIGPNAAYPTHDGRPTPPPERVSETMAVVRPLWNALQTEHATAARRIARLECKVDELRCDRIELLAELETLKRRLATVECLEKSALPWWQRVFQG